MRPHRLLLVSQPVDGGVGECVVALAAGAVGHGYEVTVASPAALGPRVVGAGAQHATLPMRRAPHPSDATAVRRLRRLCSTHDVVHLHSSKAGAAGRLALRSLGASAPPCAFTPHGWSWNVGGPLVPAYRTLERRLAGVADVVVAVSVEELEAGRRVLGGRCDIRVIENGVDTGRFRPDGPAAPRRAEPLVVCVGRLAHPKGQGDAILALARLVDPTVRLRLVGDGPDRRRLEQLASQLGVSERVEVVGAVPDPESHLRAADVAVVPSSSEGMSLAMLEAMACGCPVVSTRVPGSSVIGPGGLVVDVGDVDAMARGLEQVLDPTRRAVAGVAARQRVLAAHTMERMVAEHVSLWEALVEASRGGGQSR